MSPVTYQTIKLSKGKHSSPETGACVMELASMLAGEAFSDHPQSVCPVIGSFLRAYNDAIDDRRRQDLYAYAAKVIGSRGTAAVARARGQRLAAWADQVRPRRLGQRLLPRRLRSASQWRQPPTEAVGARAVHAIRRHSDASHATVLALVDELLAIGPPPRPTQQSLRHRPKAPPLTRAF